MYEFQTYSGSSVQRCDFRKYVHIRNSKVNSIRKTGGHRRIRNSLELSHEMRTQPEEPTKGLVTGGLILLQINSIPNTTHIQEL